MKRVLLVIDMLNDFMDPRGILFCGEKARSIIPVIQSLIRDFTNKNEPIIYLADAHQKHDKEFELFPQHAIKGSWGAEIIPELKPPEKAWVVEKTRFSGFFGTQLEEILKSLQPEEVWVTGVCTSICVMDTVGDLHNRDIRPVVVENGVADFDDQFHELALARMERIYGAKRITW